MSETTLLPHELESLVSKIFIAHNTSLENAKSVAKALVAAEVDGQKGHGLSRIAAYAAQAMSGKVNGNVTPKATHVTPATIRVDACQGFAYPAFDLAIDLLVEKTKEMGVAVAAVANSHHCGMAGYHAEKLAAQGIIGIVFSNSPKAIAPWGGKDAVFGTNPIAFATPRKEQPPLVIDLSLSKVARGKVKVAAQKQQPIPEGWALDPNGTPTTDAEAALEGTMVPMGDAKGAALVLMVEILTAALTASHFGFEASSFFDAEGESPNIGQLILAIAPGPLSEGNFFARIETLIDAILIQPGTRLPGANKVKKREAARTDGIAIDESMYRSLVTLSK